MLLRQFFQKLQNTICPSHRCGRRRNSHAVANPLVACIEIMEPRQLLSAGTVAQVGVFRGGDFFWDLTSRGYQSESSEAFGLAGDLPISGDWGSISGFGSSEFEPSGFESFGAYRNGLFYLDYGLPGYEGYEDDDPIAFGLPGDLPIAGDWDGNGIDEVGVFRNGLFYLDTGARGYQGELPFAFGLPGDKPIAGDWDGNGIDEVGVYRNGQFYLDTGARGYQGELPFAFGLPGDKPIAGDWNGDRRDEVGVFRDGQFYLDTGTPGYQGEQPFAFGLPGDLPFAGVINELPIGAFNLNANGTLTGFALDFTTGNEAAEVLVLVDGPSHSNSFDEYFHTNLLRTDVNSYYSVTGNHGFNYVLPQQFFDGSNYRITVSAQDSSDKSYYPLGPSVNFRYAPEIVVDNVTDGQTTSVDFGSPLIGATPPTQTFTVRNTGTAPLTLGQVNVPLGFTVTEGLTGSLAAGGVDTFTIRLNTSISGPYSGQVSFSTNDADESLFKFPVKGLVVTPTPEVDVVGITDGQSTPVSFGTVVTGTTVTKDFTVKNPGTGVLTLGQLSVGAGYSLVANASGIIGLPASLAPNASAVFRLKMDTATAGTRSATIQFSNNDSNESPYNFIVSGLVQLPTPEVDVVGIVDGQTAPVSFGTVLAGNTVTKDFTVKNTGTGTLTLGPVQVGGGFTLVANGSGVIGLPSSLAPNASAVFRVKMDTTTAGNRSATIQFTNNDSNESPYNFNVIGVVQAPEVEVVGVLDGQLAPISFGMTTLGTVVTRDFTVKNTGSATLTLGAVQVGAGFTLVANGSGVVGLPSSLSPNASAVFRVQMDTTIVRVLSATIQFTNNDANESPYNFAVSGTVKLPTSNFGTVVAAKYAASANGTIQVKQVQTFGAAGNNMRLYADFRSPGGAVVRSDVPVGEFSLYGNQTMPHVTAIDSNNFAIAWFNTNVTTTGGIHYAIMNIVGAIYGERDRIANITFNPNRELTSISTRPGGGFRIGWRDTLSGRLWYRDFNSVGVGTTGEIRV